MNSPLEKTLAALERNGCILKRDGEGWRTSCPSPMHAHGNQKNPALSISEGNDGAVLIKCHAGCNADDIVVAIGLDLKDLFPPKDYQPARKPEKPLPERTSLPDGVDGISRFTYMDTDKHPVIYVTRQDTPDGKRIRQWGHGPDGKGWIQSLKHAPKPRPLYRLPTVLKADGVVCIHEGEKAAVVACKALLHGIHTTTIGGAGNARHTDFTPLKGRDVVIYPDNDEPGRKHAAQVAKLAQDAGAKSVKIVRLPGLPHKGDCVEWLQAGGTDEQWRKLIAETVPEPGKHTDLIRLSDVKPEPVRWLWPGRIALGKLTMIAGDPGLGKSLLTVELAAHVSKGKPWPVDGSQCPRGEVMLLSAEDDLADTIRPRMDAAGGDVARVYALPMVTVYSDDGKASKRVPSLVDDVERIGAMLAAHPDIRLLTIDPISAYLAGVDSYMNTAMRAVLSPWADLASRYRVAIVCISHLNKGAGSAMYRTAGSIAFMAAARACFSVSKDKDDELRRLVLPVKNNLGPDEGGLAYRVGTENGIPCIQWEPEAVHITAEDALSADSEHRSATDEATEWLREVLADGPMKATEAQKEARQAGISDKALRSARERLKVKPHKRGFQGAWVWEMPSKDAQNVKDAHHNTRAPLEYEGIFEGDLSPFDNELPADDARVMVSI